MMFIKSSTTSIIILVLLLLPMGVYAFPLLEELGPNCDLGNLKEAFKNCETLKKERFNNFTPLKIKVWL